MLFEGLSAYELYAQSWAIRSLVVQNTNQRTTSMSVFLLVLWATCQDGIKCIRNVLGETETPLREKGKQGEPPDSMQVWSWGKEERKVVPGSNQLSTRLSGRPKSLSPLSEESQVSQKWACLRTFPELCYWLGSAGLQQAKRWIDFQTQQQGSLANCAPRSPRSERLMHMTAQTQQNGLD